MPSNNDIEKNSILKSRVLENAKLSNYESTIQGNKNEYVKDETSDQGKDPLSALSNTEEKILNSEVKNMKVELIMFLFMFCYILRAVTSTTMIMQKVCVVHLGYSEVVCNNLTSVPGLKSTVEKMANNYGVGHSLIQLVPSAFLSLFIGSWSDKYSRKIPIIAGLIGIIIDGFGSTLCAYFINSRAEYYFIPAVFTGISGGIIGVLLVLYSYGSDITSRSNRTMKYAFMEMAFAISMPLGSLAGGWIFHFLGYVPVFLASTCGSIIALFLVIFFLSETRGLDNEDSWSVKWRAFWSLDAAITGYKATIKRRSNKGSLQIWLLMLSMSLGTFSLAGKSLFHNS